jgi:hypothetical protein
MRFAPVFKGGLVEAVSEAPGVALFEGADDHIIRRERSQEHPALSRVSLA